MALFLNTTLTWNDGGPQTHLLNIPLQEVRPSARINRWVRESLDFSQREVFTAGSGVYEVVAVVRYDNMPQTLIDALLAGVRGLTITYSDGTNSHACYIIEPGGSPIDVGFDRDQKQFDEHLVEIRLRKTDGTAFASSIFTG